MLLKKLTSLPGVSGCEDSVRKFIASHFDKENTHIDCMGNLLVGSRGEGKKIMLAAHMDEVGLIISEICDNGFLKFKTVGGVSAEVLTGKRVLIGDTPVPGIIGVRAVHLQKKEERETPLLEKQLYIDIGAENKEEAQKMVSLGECAVFDTPFTPFGSNLVCAKALDDRAGCAIMLEIAKMQSDKNLCFAFTTQEEVGCRGARAAAEYLKPDIALIIESTICTDFHKTKPHQEITTMGQGPVITFYDRAAIPDRGVMDSLVNAAKEHGIPWQYKRTTMGGTDAGAISRSGEGIPTAVIALPCRNLHSPSTVISLDDYENAIKLIKEWVLNF